ncbi:hypothetical protein [Hymenobacter sp. BRD67]|uniref:hypothetical protein n=1 Tax=Hymenobacter sp. BRD67 TaxID=2675877 RepID=UPI0015632796|nr:hypothetical protein [Hymenobacter sp. BRD67]QKG53657.1 hypothetical protein GKZ67_14925 [Hymenobacter sp. BRD67]
MRYSISQFQHFLRVALLALPVLLLLGLNGRTVSLLRPGRPTPAQLSAAPRATVVKQKVLLEAASPLGSYVAPAFALAWLPGILPASWLPRLVRRVVARLYAGNSGASVALVCRLRLLATTLAPQAP